MIAIIRLRRLRAGDEIAHALTRGGIDAVEVTVPTPGGLEAISRWRAAGMEHVGAGTVRTTDDAKRALDAGALFLVTPTTVPSVLDTARVAGIPVVCGALTPTEIDTAWQYGASAVKVFPIDSVGGPAYLKAVLGPIDDVPLIPTGGVDADTTRAYAELGCAGVGVGGALVDEATVAAGDWDRLTERAATLVAAWKAGRDG